MRVVEEPERLAEVLGGSAGWSPRVASWSADGRLLASDVPVSRGSITYAVSSDKICELSLVVPRRVDGVDWSPRGNPDHPLARFGQRLDVSVIVTSKLGGVWTLRQGRFLVTGWQESPSAITVTGEGMLRLAKDSATASPVQPTAGETFAALARRLAPAGVSVAFDDALVDRAVPSAAITKSGRLEALAELADAWPALLRSDDWGQALFRAPLPEVPTPVLEFTDGLVTGARGTVVSAPFNDNRDGYNVVRARSSAPGLENLYAEARTTSGPMAVDTYGEVVQEWSTPLATTRAALQTSAESLRARSVRPSRSRTVTHAPDPRIELDDPVSVHVDGAREWGYVTGYKLPLTVEDGDMTTTVAVAA
ncbi:hypothetical protein [Antribacter gilvus]|uniref:hypothetical protein n=1 Tax=Antribacter gilvus TaxID=2304675 RepID=UPI000F783DDE|nr:hypothetical protein [Antribacter gilvus]